MHKENEMKCEFGICHCLRINYRLMILCFSNTMCKLQPKGIAQVAALIANIVVPWTSTENSVQIDRWVPGTSAFTSRNRIVRFNESKTPDTTCSKKIQGYTKVKKPKCKLITWETVTGLLFDKIASTDDLLACPESELSLLLLEVCVPLDLCASAACSHICRKWNVQFYGQN